MQMRSKSNRKTKPFLTCHNTDVVLVGPVAGGALGEAGAGGAVGSQHVLRWAGRWRAVELQGVQVGQLLLLQLLVVILVVLVVHMLLLMVAGVVLLVVLMAEHQTNTASPVVSVGGTIRADHRTTETTSSRCQQSCAGGSIGAQPPDTRASLRIVARRSAEGNCVVIKDIHLKCVRVGGQRIRKGIGLGVISLVVCLVGRQVWLSSQLLFFLNRVSSKINLYI